jgi:hypothetical protein
MPDEFESRLLAFAERAKRIKAHCAGEDATRIYLVLPFVELLGYDVGDPSTIVPEHEDAINFAIMIDGQPAIAIEATGAARPTCDTYPRLRDYCDAHPTVSLGIATNGTVLETFIDSVEPGMLDPEPFLRIDLIEVATDGLDAQAVELLRMMQASVYDAEAIAERVYALSLRDKLKPHVLDAFRNPSEALCRLMLEQVGIMNPRPDVVEQHYRPIVKSAMEHAIIVPVLEALRQLPAPRATVTSAEPAARGTPAEIAEEPQPQASNDEEPSEDAATFAVAKRRSA